MGWFPPRLPHRCHQQRELWSNHVAKLRFRYEPKDSVCRADSAGRAVRTTIDGAASQSRIANTATSPCWQANTHCLHPSATTQRLKHAVSKPSGLNHLAISPSTTTLQISVVDLSGLPVPVALVVTSTGRPHSRVSGTIGSSPDDTTAHMVTRWNIVMGSGAVVAKSVLPAGTMRPRCTE